MTALLVIGGAAAWVLTGFVGACAMSCAVLERVPWGWIAGGPITLSFGGLWCVLTRCSKNNFIKQWDRV